MKDFFKAIINFFKTLFSKRPIIDNTMDETISNETDTIVNTETNNEIIDEPGLGEPVEHEQNNCEMVILIDNGHGHNTPGKKSPYSCYGVKPEIEFCEYKWNREIAEKVQKGLSDLGYDSRLLVPETIDISLKERVNRTNKICSQFGTSNVILISIHANAAGNGTEWKTARGWSAFTTKGTTKSDSLAECLYNEAMKNFNGHKIRIDKTDGDNDMEENYYILYNTLCPAVLTENFFYDNIDDVKYILSEEGREAVIKTHVDGIINYINSLKK